MAVRKLEIPARVAKRFPAPKAIGILKETKTDSMGRPIENRVIMTPKLVKRLIKMTKLPVFVTHDAGAGIGASDKAYVEAGAEIATRMKVLGLPFILGVKETQKGDHQFLVDGVHMTYEHFADSLSRTMSAILTSRTKGTAFVALETMQDIFGRFPTLMPMSEAAAEIVSQLAPSLLLKPNGLGELPSGLPQSTIKGLKAVVLGGGIVGRTAALRLGRMGVDVTLLEADRARRLKLSNEFDQLWEDRGFNVVAEDSNPISMSRAFKEASILVSGVYRRGTNPPKITTNELLNRMKAGAVAFFVDIDQGGSYAGKLPETSVLERNNLPLIPGTHVRTFSPPNLPSMAAVHTSQAIGESVMPFAVDIAKKGLIRAALDDPTIETGINIIGGEIYCKALAQTFANEIHDRETKRYYP